ncbi:polysaccharide biosynthesis protein [Stenotrophomonas panacihumi]|uniref:Polysaccharide biosynthesis protein n=1 Tax=Stenotrophomonas panacihumi TaxID=676599 RepID=A0A0R0AR19_9GAMM|nr:rhamnan synthesis F family protein [Stenotrophomonas panacihumi]KRG43591.1 polysaccharide biosynthesis protein [Stenotrophomonas panacihumi]PTN55337.1 polysaccharide biosynthesis protein [Stenotrophomonas panacihumi]
MIGGAQRYLEAARQAIERHGGGWRGLRAVVVRSLKVVRALGVAGFVNRLRRAGGQAPTLAPVTHHAFPEPLPLAQVTQRVGVMAHVFYADLAEELARDLAHMPVPYELLVSVVDEPAAAQVRQHLSSLPLMSRLVVRVVPNRGRDIAPLLVAFREEVLQLDLVCHVHTKKSLYTGSEQSAWRRYLMSSLFGSRDRLAWLLGMFAAESRLGMIYPESYAGVPLWAHTWLSNADVCEALAARLGFAIQRGRYLDFPAGSMFWARVDALRPLYGLDLRLEDFPEERGQVDGTLQHAVERLLACTVQRGDFLLGILPQDGALALATEGARNWTAAFEMDLATRVRLSAVDAELVTVDIFDTLVTRPFLTPEAARAHLALRVEQRTGATDFAALRERAETRARIEHGRDPTLEEIHASLAQLRPALGDAGLLTLECEHEALMLRPREGMLGALAGLRDKCVAALSDMYLSTETLRRVLPAAVSAAIDTWWVSCETGRRKDEAQTWQHIAAREHVAPAHWLHVGDNERADIQMPQLQRLLTPVHVLRPAALLDVVPALRSLRHPGGDRAAWPEQLWRGLVANHFAALADRDPARIAPAPRLTAESAGYAVLGPLLLDYLAWLHRVARETGIDTVLFLSREGHLLAQAHAALMRHVPEAERLRGRYLLVSRRAAGMAAMRTDEDLAALLGGSYTGTLRNLLLARLGDAALASVASVLDARLAQEVFLPDMHAQVMQWLAPAVPALLAVAETEREAYLHYWQSEVGDAAAMVADIGYAGSIQKYLSRMTGRPLGGAYFALRRGAHQLQGLGWAMARHHDGREQDHEASPILQHDLLLEALLAAPSGQFCRFHSEGGERVAEFAPMELDARGVAVLERLHRGALDFIEDAARIAGPDIAHLQFDPQGVTTPLDCFASGQWQHDGWLTALGTEDAFTGRGRVVPGR